MNATNSKTENKVETTKVLTSAQQKALDKKAKLQADKASQLVFKIGTHKVTLLSNVTTLKAFKSVVSVYFKMYNLDKKETIILLPNDTKMKFADLNTVKNFSKLLFPAYYLDKSGNEQTQIFLNGIEKIQSVLLETRIDFNLVGTVDGAKILTLYKNASKEAYTQKVITTNLIG